MCGVCVKGSSLWCSSNLLILFSVWDSESNNITRSCIMAFVPFGMHSLLIMYIIIQLLSPILSFLPSYYLWRYSVLRFTSLMHWFLWVLNMLAEVSDMMFTWPWRCCWYLAVVHTAGLLFVPNNCRTWTVSLETNVHSFKWLQSCGIECCHCPFSWLLYNMVFFRFTCLFHDIFLSIELE